MVIFRRWIVCLVISGFWIFAESPLTLAAEEAAVSGRETEVTTVIPEDSGDINLLTTRDKALAGEQDDTIESSIPLKNELRFRYRSGRRTLGSSDQPSPYLYLREIFSQPGRYEGGFVLARSPGELDLTFPLARDYFLKKYWWQQGNSDGHFRLLAGNYRLSFGEGLIFYQPVDEVIRPLRPPPYQLLPDRGTNSQAYLRGVASELNLSPETGFTFFYSRGLLDTRLNSAGLVDEDVEKIRDDVPLVDDYSELEQTTSLSERLLGGHFRYRGLGFTAVRGFYSPGVNPEQTAYGYQHVFRGDTFRLYGMDFRQEFPAVTLSGEYAYSLTSGIPQNEKDGDSIFLRSEFSIPGGAIFFAGYRYQPEYYSRHAKAIQLFSYSLVNNERGGLAGFDLKRKGQGLYGYYHYAQTREPEWTGSGSSNAPLFPATGREIFGEGWIDFLRRFQFRLRCRINEKEELFNSESTNYLQGRCLTQRYQADLSYEEKKDKYLIRYVQEREHPVAGFSNQGDYFLFRARRNFPWSNFTIQTVYFYGPEVELYVSEPYWEQLYLARSLGKGIGLRNSCIWGSGQLFRHFSFWLAYSWQDYFRYGESLAGEYPYRKDFLFPAQIQELHLQLDYHW